MHICRIFRIKEIPSFFTNNLVSERGEKEQSRTENKETTKKENNERKAKRHKVRTGKRN
jgi:hypothetical protein